MKILFQSFEIMNLLLNNNTPVGGAAVEWYAWMKGFIKNGDKFGFLTEEGANDLVEKKEFEYDLVESYHLDKGFPKIRLLTYRIPQFYKAIKNYNPDFIVQGTANEFTGIIALIAKILSIPFVHRIGSDMDVDGRIEKNFSRLSMMTYYFGVRNASLISCQNKYQHKVLKEKYPDKSLVIHYNPFEISKSFEQNITKEYIAWIGNFRYEKNLPALAKIAKEMPDYKFKIAGTKFENSDKDAEEGLNELENLSNVEFVGHIKNSDIPEFLSKAFCLLNTSRLEGFSNTFLEAWAVGVPVVTTKNVNPDNLIKEYSLGVVCENYETIPEDLNNLIEKKLFKNYYLNCIDYVKQKHDPQVLAKQLLQEMNNSK